MTKYYDGTKLLSLKDMNGQQPEIYICTSNRSAGKTTYFSRLLVNRYLKSGRKFLLLYRYKNELDDVSEKFFKDIGTLFFPSYAMIDRPGGGGLFRVLKIGKASDELTLKEWEGNAQECGYAVALNSADNVKKYSHLFSDVDSVLFDEFQSETGTYLPKEIQKFISIHTTVARGAGEMVRYVPVYMLSNPVSLLNPYYGELGVSTRLQSTTHFLRGDGYVLEQGYNPAASQAQKTSAFNRAFAANQYAQYAAEGIYLNDNLTFIGKPSGQSTYFCTLRYEGAFYAIREYWDEGVVYCDDHPDLTGGPVLTISSDDHDVNYLLVRKNATELLILRFYFEHGCFRFKNLRCKSAILTLLSIK